MNQISRCFQMSGEFLASFILETLKQEPPAVFDYIIFPSPSANGVLMHRCWGAGIFEGRP